MLRNQTILLALFALYFLLVTAHPLLPGSNTLIKRSDSDAAKDSPPETDIEFEALRRLIFQADNNVLAGNKLLEIIPTIKSTELRQQGMKLALTYIKDNCAVVISKMLSHGWIPSADDMSLVIRRRMFVIFRLFLDAGWKFSGNDTLSVGGIFSGHKSDPALWNMGESMVYRKVMVPGVENAAIDFLLQEKRIPHEKKTAFLQESLLVTIQPQKMKEGTLGAVIREKEYDWAVEMMKVGWPKEFSQDELKQIRDSKHSGIILAVLARVEKFPPKESFLKRVVHAL